jgi:predicted nucleic acid-binding protein
VTRYLLDRDVMSQLDQPEAKRHKNVRAWFRTVPDSDLFVSAITVMEAWRGFARARRMAGGSPKAVALCDGYEEAFERLMATFDGRVVPVDERVARIWGRLRGRSDRNQWDLGVAATAIVYDMVVATRNTGDFKGRGVRVVDPFRAKPDITGP